MHHPFCTRESLLRLCRRGTHRPFRAGRSCTLRRPPLDTGGVREAAIAATTLWFSSLDSLKLIQKVTLSPISDHHWEGRCAFQSLFPGPQQLSMLDVGCLGGLEFSLPTRVGKVIALPCQLVMQDFLTQGCIYLLSTGTCPRNTKK